MFQSLKGIRVNFGLTTVSYLSLPNTFQSLKGIRVNFGPSLVAFSPSNKLEVSIPERDSGKFRAILINWAGGIYKSFQSLKGIRVNFGGIGFQNRGLQNLFQSLKGIRVNFGLRVQGGLCWLRNLFQSLKGIRVNFKFSPILLGKYPSCVSIPERDSGKFRGVTNKRVCPTTHWEFQSLKGIRVNFGSL